MAKADIWMPFYVADYLSDTMHLSPAEHGGYLMLILHYWKSGPIPDDDNRLAIISRLGDAWSNSSSTLRAFFEQCDGMLVHRRIDKEKADASDNQERNQARAKAAAAKRWGNQQKNAQSNATSMPQAMLDECPSPSPSPSDKPLKSKTDTPAAPKYSALDDLINFGVEKQIAVDWLAVRKTKKLASTKTAIDGVLREIGKAGMSADDGLRICCERGWAGFNPSWVAQQPARASPARESRHSGFDKIDYSEGVIDGRIG